MQCNGTTYVGVVEDDLGEIRFTFCDACRTIAVDAAHGNLNVSPSRGSVVEGALRLISFGRVCGP